MGFYAWFGHNWFTILQSTGIIAGLIFTGLSFRDNVRARQVATLIQITASHREIWQKLLTHPELYRISRPNIDLSREPVTENEELIVRLLVLHLNSAYQAAKVSGIVRIEGMGKDIQTFFSLPIPRAVWTALRSLQNEDFVRYVESHLASQNLPR